MFSNVIIRETSFQPSLDQQLPRHLFGTDGARIGALTMVQGFLGSMNLTASCTRQTVHEYTMPKMSRAAHRRGPSLTSIHSPKFSRT
ncbi:hypothetical protein BST61_g6577 [Cercospora zeina]